MRHRLTDAGSRGNPSYRVDSQQEQRSFDSRYRSALAVVRRIRNLQNPGAQNRMGFDPGHQLIGGEPLITQLSDEAGG